MHTIVKILPVNYIIKGNSSKFSVANNLRYCRDDYNGLPSDIFQTILLNFRPLIHYLSNAMCGCPIKLGANVAINGFCLIISENL